MLTTHLTTRTSRSTAPASRGGFTLVELLVSITLVVIMMYAFSQVFRIATETIIQTRGIANNDEKARTLTTILKSDLETRTFKTVAPWGPDEDPDNDYPPLTDLKPAERTGYFYVSENDINDDSDDVFQLTVDRFNGDAVPNTSFNNLIFGQAVAINGAITEENQPIWDDFDPKTDSSGEFRGTGASQFAEVCYFVRNGSLYRRVLLVRRPMDRDNMDYQPDDGTTDLIVDEYDSEDPNSAVGESDFWRDFDYSAYLDTTPATPKVNFNGVGNGESSLENFGGVAKPLADPVHRFGFDFESGLPREFVNGNTEYIGRYTHEETSHLNFGYPGRLPVAGSPMSAADTPTLALTQGVVSAFSGGDRISEDLLLTNVMSFDVKLWDESLGAFADVGHATSGGDFFYDDTAASAVQQNYGPLSDYDDTVPDYTPPAVADRGHVFDTWHPAIDRYDSTVGPDVPPYRPTRIDASFTEPVPRPIRAIQITIRYRDPQSDKTRQLTLQHSLID